MIFICIINGLLFLPYDEGKKLPIFPLKILQN
jgi:hypothetical protein